jgi:hypothetical protein
MERNQILDDLMDREPRFAQQLMSDPNFSRTAWEASGALAILRDTRANEDECRIAARHFGHALSHYLVERANAHRVRADMAAWSLDRIDDFGWLYEPAPRNGFAMSKDAAAEKVSLQTTLSRESISVAIDELAHSSFKARLSPDAVPQSRFVRPMDVVGYPSLYERLFRRQDAATKLRTTAAIAATMNDAITRAARTMVAKRVDVSADSRIGHLERVLKVFAPYRQEIDDLFSAFRRVDLDRATEAAEKARSEAERVRKSDTSENVVSMRRHSRAAGMGRE